MAAGGRGRSVRTWRQKEKKNRKELQRVERQNMQISSVLVVSQPLE